MARLGSIKYQVASELMSQLRIGDSKHKARSDEHTSYPDGIFSWSTYDSYKKCCCAFADWVHKTYSCNRLDKAKAYVPEYLQSRVDSGLSPWTIKLERAALSKLYHCQAADWGVDVPERRRQNISRSRNDCVRDKHFSTAKNADLVEFLQGTGLRRREAEHVRPCDIHVTRHGVSVDVVGKGGKRRSVPVLAGFESKVSRYASGSKKPIWGKIPGSCDVHGYRREYATALYRQSARPIDQLERKDKYICRADKSGVIYDKQALMTVSKALGHNRTDVVVSHYL